MPRIRQFALPLLALTAAVLAACGGSNSSNTPTATTTTPASTTTSQDALATSTPIKHVVVIFGENISFDHYFGTYPNALNTTGEPQFSAASGTQTDIDNYIKTPTLLTANPNASNTGNGTGATNPIRLDRTQAFTVSMNHNYTPEQNAFHALAMDAFPEYTGKAGTSGTGYYVTTGLVMGYYDGNTVTGMWNYAQHFAMSDAFYDTQFGPSTPGALNLISGQTNGAVPVLGTAAADSLLDDGAGTSTYTMIGDVDPAGDTCSSTTATATMSGKNIGDMLNSANVTWGWFEGGFDLTKTNANGTTGCLRSSYSSVLGGYKADYVPHHEPFQYYKTTANLAHTRPTSTALIGTSTDAANHQYDTNDFFTAVAAGNFPSVSFLKAPAYQDAHANNSDPLDEQAFVTKVVNFLQLQSDWKNTVVIQAYDDSDGWYDHAYKIVGGSANTTSDTLSACQSTSPLKGLNGVAVNGRCGYGPRLPLLVISPYAKANYVDHTVVDQSSIMRFIEDNWLSSQRLGQGSYDSIAGSIQGMFDFTSTGGSTAKLYLDNSTGLQVKAGEVATDGTTAGS